MGIDSSTATPRSGASAIGGAPTPKPPPASADQFMRLLMAQLQNQNPLDPQKSSEFVTQLAQIAQIEQTAQVNTHLATMEAGQAASSRATLSGLVGKTVTARASAVTVPEGGAPPAVLAHLDQAASDVSVTLRDASGKAVRTLKLGARGAGDAAVPWDGKNENGSPVPPGRYAIEIKATGADGKEVTSTARIRGLIDSIDFENGKTRFHVGEITISPEDIISIGMSDPDGARPGTTPIPAGYRNALIATGQS